MLNRWDEKEAESLGDLELRVYSSRLIGQDPELVLHGGGNTSVKIRNVLYVKGSGCDMAEITKEYFPGLVLDKLERLRDLDELSDEEMVELVNEAKLMYDSPRPSVEALLHAFLPHKFIDHSHADAVLALANQEKPEEILREVYGDDALLVPYVMPGFKLAKEVDSAFRENPRNEFAILLNHGLFTWGDSARESYDKMIEVVSKAEDYIKRRSGTSNSIKDSRDKLRSNHIKSLKTREILPLVRGALLDKKILHYDDSDEVLSLLDEADSSAFQKGPLTPDHLIYTKARPLFINFDEVFSRDKILGKISRYFKDYKEYFDRNKKEGVKMHDPSPRVILIPGVGMITTGKDAEEARKVSDLYLHTMRVIRDAERVGRYGSLPNEKDVYDMEYWPLELKKLEGIERKELDGKIVLVTGGSRGIGRGIVEKLAEEGAHVGIFDKVVPLDDDFDEKYGKNRVAYIDTDISDEETLRSSFEEFIFLYGGIDILINNAGIFRMGKMLDDKKDGDFDQDLRDSLAVNFEGHARLSREAAKVMRDQGTGGKIISISSKQVPGPGPGFFPYGVSKAALEQMVRYHALEFGEYGITSNVVRFGDILETWPEEMRKSRAEAHGVSVEELPEFYGNRTTLKKPLTVKDAAKFVYNMLKLDNMNGSILHCDNGMKDVWLR